MHDAAHTPVPEDRKVRVRQALSAALDALRLAEREAEGAGADESRFKWAALGIVSALQGALVAALSGYETAHLDAVLNPAQSDRIAPVAVLLRRARSADYLNPPERVDLPGRSQRAVERVLKVRNSAVHALEAPLPETIAADLGVVAELVRDLVLVHPAFDPAPARLSLAGIEDALQRLLAALNRTTPT